MYRYQYVSFYSAKAMKKSLLSSVEIGELVKIRVILYRLETMLLTTDHDLVNIDYALGYAQLESCLNLQYVDVQLHILTPGLPKY